MGLARTDLIKLLETVEPARSNKLVVPLLAHYWFQGGRITAFNDIIAISVKTDLKLTGAIPGQLLQIARASNGAKEVELTEETKGSIILKAGRSKSTFQTMDVSESKQIFTMPKAKSDPIEFVSLGTFLSVLREVMRSVGTDTSVPDTCGVTFVPDGDCVRLYATNDKTLSAGQVQLKHKADFDKCILSSEFCEQFLALADDKSKIDFSLENDGAIVDIDGVQLYGRFRHSANPIDFKDILKRYAPEDAIEELVEQPKFSEMLERASIIAGAGADEVHTSISVVNGELTFYTESKISKNVDRCAIAVHHPDVEMRAAIKWLKLGVESMPESTRIVFRKNAIVMLHASPKNKARGDVVYVIAAGK